MAGPSLLDRFRRRPADAAPQAAPQAPATPQGRVPAPGALRRERRALVRTREERIRDLGGLMLEMYRRDRFRQDLLVEQCLEVVTIEERLRDIDSLLEAAVTARRQGLRASAASAERQSSGARTSARTAGARSARSRSSRARAAATRWRPMRASAPTAARPRPKSRRRRPVTAPLRTRARARAKPSAQAIPGSASSCRQCRLSPRTSRPYHHLRRPSSRAETAPGAERRTSRTRSTAWNAAYGFRPGRASWPCSLTTGSAGCPGIRATGSGRCSSGSSSPRSPQLGRSSLPATTTPRPARRSPPGRQPSPWTRCPTRRRRPARASEPPPADTDTEPVEPEPPPPGAGGLVEWPPGQTGYTIVLASLPESAGRTAAVGAAQKASQAGLTDTGVLNSSDYSSLHPGYWVVFSGIFDTLDEAKKRPRHRAGNLPAGVHAADRPVTKRLRSSALGAGATGSSRARATACAGTACPCESSRGSAGRRRRTRRPRSAPR